MDILQRAFESWNLPDVLNEASGWIRDNEINVVTFVVDAFDDPANEVCSTVWRVVVKYMLD